jgi:hypothetical protein
MDKLGSIIHFILVLLKTAIVWRILVRELYLVSIAYLQFCQLIIDVIFISIKIYFTEGALIIKCHLNLSMLSFQWPKLRSFDVSWSALLRLWFYIFSTRMINIEVIEVFMVVLLK